MKLINLMGAHELMGVDFGSLAPRPEAYQDDPSQVMYFCLDGKVYGAVEDPSDGYRSSMEDLVISDRAMVNTFAPVTVVGVHQLRGNYNEVSDILELIDIANGKVVLACGTRNTDDYYPCYVAGFHPENMACNAKENL